MTTEQLLQALAEREVDCSCYQGQALHRYGDGSMDIEPDGPCPVCNGSGKVAQFPSLREECPRSDIGFTHARCLVCQGRGWVLSQHDLLARLLEDVNEGGWMGVFFPPFWWCEADPLAALVEAVTVALAPRETLEL